MKFYIQSQLIWFPYIYIYVAAYQSCEDEDAGATCYNSSQKINCKLFIERILHVHHHHSCPCLCKMLNPLHKSIKTKINLGKYSCLCLLKMFNPVHKSIKKTKTNLGKHCFHVVIFNNNHFNFLRSSNTIGLNKKKKFFIHEQFSNIINLVHWCCSYIVFS